MSDDLDDEAASDEDDGWREVMHRDFDAARGRPAKLAVLMRYMPEALAREALGFMLGTAHGDCVDTSGQDFGRSPKKPPEEPSRKPRSRKKPGGGTSAGAS